MSHPSLEHQKYLDSLGITAVLRERGPTTYHDLVVTACARGMDVSRDFDQALLLALHTCLIKGQFAVCTFEEAEAYHKNAVRPRFDKPAPEPETTIHPPPEDLAFKLIQQRSDWIKAGKGEEDE